MNLSQIMKRNMPHQAIDATQCIKFSDSLRRTMGFDRKKNGSISLDTLIMASMTNSYVEGSSQLTGACGQTVRNHLKDKNSDELLQINRGLIVTLRDMGFLKNPMIVAMDWHDEMYYGDLDTEGIIGTKNNRGTNYAYEYASVSIVVHDARFVIAVSPVTDRTIVDMVSKLIDIVHSVGIRIKVLLMDGGFYSIDAVGYMQSGGIKFIMHSPKLRKVCEGTEVDVDYTTSTHNRRKDEQASFRLVSVYGRNRKDRILYVLATNTDFTPKDVLKFYKKRWGIETGYRMIRKFLAKTTSKRYKTRLLYFYFAILLYNFWVLVILGSRMRIIADVMRTLIASTLVRTKPFMTNFCIENRASGGDF